MDKQNLFQIRNVIGSSKTFQFTSSPNVYDGVVSQYEPSGSESQFYAFDMTGSNRVATHITGNIPATFDYTAFGTEYYVTGGTNMMNRFGGKWGYFRPSPNGLLYIQQRWLDVVLAQWLARDPIWPEGGWNPYLSVGNNPVRWPDPTGLQTLTWPIGSIGTGIGTETGIGAGIGAGAAEGGIIAACAADPACWVLVAAILVAYGIGPATAAAIHYFWHRRPPGVVPPGSGCKNMHGNPECTAKFEDCTNGKYYGPCAQCKASCELHDGVWPTGMCPG